MGCWGACSVCMVDVWKVGCELFYSVWGVCVGCAAMCLGGVNERCVYAEGCFGWAALGKIWGFIHM